MCEMAGMRQCGRDGVGQDRVYARVGVRWHGQDGVSETGRGGRGCGRGCV